jgi:hypothetical protein
MLKQGSVPIPAGNKRRRPGWAACPMALARFFAGCGLAASMLAFVGQPASAGALPVGKTYESRPPVPAPGTCHGRGVLPDPKCTPGAINPAVTPADISSTICKAGWTATVRPPESYTEALKAHQMAAYGDTAPISKYEEDHLVSLELGGAPSDPRNLWPEFGASPNPKDRVENAAKAAVCAHRLNLASAQLAIATNWVALGETLGLGDLAGQVPVPGPAHATTSTLASSGGTPNTSSSGHYYQPGEYCPERDLGKTITDPYGTMTCENPASGGRPRWERAS